MPVQRRGGRRGGEILAQFRGRGPGERERPDHLAVCFDKGGSVARKEAFPEYKANRDATPDAIRTAVPYIYNILKAMNIPIMVKEGYEADDVIGTLAKKAEKEGYKTFMVTPDKDFAQLVSENIFMYRPMFGGGYETWGIPEVQEKFEVTDPLQVIDFLGMMGDSSDNIPGLPGVGEKTAKKFLAAYGSMEGLLKNTHELKGKMKEKVEANGDLGILSKQLFLILYDMFIQDKFSHGSFETVVNANKYGIIISTMSIINSNITSSCYNCTILIKKRRRNGDVRIPL